MLRILVRQLLSFLISFSIIFKFSLVKLFPIENCLRGVRKESVFALTQVIPSFKKINARWDIEVGKRDTEEKI